MTSRRFRCILPHGHAIDSPSTGDTKLGTDADVRCAVTAHFHQKRNNLNLLGRFAAQITTIKRFFRLYARSF